MRKGDLEWTEIGSEILIFSNARLSFYKLNKTGAFIWKNLERKKSLKNIVKKIVGKYGITEEKAKKDLKEFIGGLKKEKLMEFNLNKI
ncbi:MAG: PqqD family protein [archaeon]